MKQVFQLNFRGRDLIVEHGELAKQANGAVLVRYGDTVVLSTAVVSNNANLLSDFFSVDGTLSGKTIFGRKNTGWFY